jgi:hypothetical protein
MLDTAYDREAGPVFGPPPLPGGAAGVDISSTGVQPRLASRLVPKLPQASVVAPAIVGFLLGAVFWHFIGFWGFVREIVYKGPVGANAIVEQTGSSCTSLILERTTGSVRAAPCPLDAAWLSEGAGTSRADFAGLEARSQPKRWSVTVQAEIDADPKPAASAE